MRWMWMWIAGFMVLGVFVFPFPSTNQRFARISYPTPGIGPALEKLYGEHDWQGLAADCGLELKGKAAEDFQLAIESAVVVPGDHYLTVEIKSETSTSILLGDTRVVVRKACDLIEARLEIDAIELSYEKLDATGRKNVLWRLHGMGFDSLEKKLLDQVLLVEKDPAVLAFARALRASLTR